MKLALAVLLAATTCCAQTATTAPQTVTTSAPVTKEQKITIKTSMWGGSVTFTIPAQTLAPVTATVPGQTVPVDMAGFTGTFACKLSADSKVITNPDGTHTTTGLLCSITSVNP